ncbi:MAG: hypothetical protein HKP60_08030 [Eudoraea sp.]|nr:hypothetical protein [Eudoraea sp.]NNJ40800.1 hypothetical protein [Eudoraea sp.]
MAKKTNNPFKELDKLVREVPPNLKKKVMNDVATAKLLMELASLFTLNYQSLISGMFKSRRKN